MADEVNYVLGVVSQTLADKVAALDLPAAFADGEHPETPRDTDLSGIEMRDVPTIFRVRVYPGAGSGREVTVLVPRRSGRRFAILVANPNAPRKEAVLVDAHVCEELTGWSVNSTTLVEIV